MDERNVITYDENWQSVTEPEYYTPPDDEEAEEPQPVKEVKSKRQGGHLLLTIQLIVCGAAALCALALKGAGGEWYRAAKQWYAGNLNNSAVFDSRISFDLSSLFTKATPDEAEASTH